MTARPQIVLAALLCTTGTCLAQTDPRHFSTYFGGTGKDYATVVAVAPNGDLVIAGHSDATDLVVTQGAFQPNRAGTFDVFVARLSADGSQVLASTYLGGSQRDLAYHVEVAQDGSIWVGGSTDSPDFPTTLDAFAGHAGRTDAFVAHLDGNLTNLLYATAFGGGNSERADAVVIDEQNKLIYIAGAVAIGSQLPTTPTAFRTSGSFDCFMAVLDLSVVNQTTLAYSTLIGGSGLEDGVDGLSVDANGIVTVTATGASTDMAVTPGAVQSSAPGAESGFVTVIDPNQSGASSLVYSSYFGGSGKEQLLGHVVDASGVLHLLAISFSADLSTTSNALLTSAGGSSDAFYAQLDPSRSGSAGLLYGSWIAAGPRSEGSAIGNPGFNGGAAIASGPAGIAVVLTTGSRSGLASTAGAFQPNPVAGFHGFAMLLDVTTGPDPFVAYATHYRGCAGSLFTGAVTFHPSGDLLFVGWTDQLPVTLGAAQFQRAGTSDVDGFVTRLQPTPWPSAFRSFGAACPGTAGTPTLTGVTPARICKTLSVQMTGLAPGQVGAIYFGRSNTWGGFPLPFSLASIGAPGCFVHVGLEVVIGLSTGTGAANFSVAVGDRPELLGQEVFLQYVCVDPGANALGGVTTNGLAAEVRW